MSEANIQQGQEQSQALSTAQQPSHGFGAMIQSPPQPQGQPAQIIALDRETLTFYGNMITAANLVPFEKGVSPEISKYRVMAKVVAGTSYGFDPVLSQSCFDVINNRMGPNAHGMEILFRDSGEYDTRIVRLDDEYGCKVQVLKRVNAEWSEARAQYTGGEWTLIGEVEFTIEMAKKAGLIDKNPTWKLYPADMAYSKVMKRVVKRYNPTCLRPRILLGNHFAKQAPQIAAPATPDKPLEMISVEASDGAGEVTPGTGEVYRDQLYTESEARPYVPALDDDDAVEAEIVEFSGPAAVSEPIVRDESERLALLDAVSDKEKDVAKLQKTTVEKVRNGRDLKTMDVASLSSYYSELDLMT